MTLTGVNLGGWLVIEKWMTPELFEGLDATNEYELSQTEGDRARIARHRKEFITEADIKWLSQHSVRLLRVPIGYWAITDTDDYVDARENLDWLVKITKKYNLQLLLDLHGAPGAQNTRDHSGSGNIPHRKWLRNKQAQQETIGVLCDLARRYRDEPHIWGIELLNEPDPGIFGLRLAWWYRRAYRELVNMARPGTHIIFSDGYRPWLLSNTFGLIKNPQYPVVMDMHLYQCFGLFKRVKAMKYQLHITKWRRIYVKFFSLAQPVMVGEWSASLPFSTNRSDTNRFIQAQLHSFDDTAAQCFWNYKLSGSGRWSFRTMVERGAFHEYIAKNNKK